MRRLRYYVLIACLVAAPSVAWAEKRVALIFSAQDYEAIRPLKNPRNDARLIEQALEKLGFDVTTESDRDLRRMRRALENFVDDAGEADVAFVYFAGHGVEIGGRNHLLPVDTDASSLERLRETSMPLEEIRAAVAAVAKTVLIVLDACRNDPFGAETGGEDGRGATSLAPPAVRESARPGLGRIGRAENTLFAFSAAPGETALDGAGENSPFSSALAGYLDTDGLEIRSVLTLVQQQVYDETGGRQLPYVESGLPTLFFASRSGELPEREALLLAMADITADMRAEVEQVAAANDMPLAPLYGALISADLKAISASERMSKLEEAATAYIRARTDLRNLAASDPQVARLRADAEAQMGLGAFDKARAILAEAVAIDASSADALADKLVSRRVSEAASLKATAGISLAQLDYTAAIDAYEKAAALHLRIEHEAVSDADRRARNWLLADLGDLHTQLGSTTHALDAYRRMEAAARLRLTHGGSDDAIRDVGLAMLRVADVLRAQGDIAGAQAHLEENLHMRSAQRARMEGNADWLTSVANITERMGDINRQKQDLDGALRYYDATLSFREWLVEHYADRSENRDGLLSILGRIGSVRYDKGDFAGAQTFWERQLAAARDFSADFPDRVSASIRLFDALLAVGDAALATGGKERALAAYEEAAAGARALIGRDGQQAGARYSLAQSLKGAGWAHLALGDRPAGYAAFDEALAVMDVLTGQDPLNVQWRLYRARIMSDIGTARYQASEYGEAVEVLARSIEDLRALVGSPAADRDSRLALMRAYLDLGRSRRLMDDIAEARQAYAAAVEIGRRLDLVSSEDNALRGNFEAALYNLGVMFEMLGEKEDAAKAFSDLLSLAREKDARQPDRETRRSMLDLHVRIARLSSDPRPHYMAALEVSEALAATSQLGEFDATPEQLRDWLARAR